MERRQQHSLPTLASGCSRREISTAQYFSSDLPSRWLPSTLRRTTSLGWHSSAKVTELGRQRNSRLPRNYSVARLGESVLSRQCCESCDSVLRKTILTLVP